MKNRFGILKVLTTLLFVFTTIVPVFANGNQEEANSDGKVTITIMTYEQALSDDSTGEAKAFWSAVERFKQKFPNVVVNLENVAHGNYETKLKTLAAANQLPDLYQVKGSWVPDFIENERMRPIDDMLALYDDWDENMKEGSFSNFTSDQKIYAVPNKVTSTLIYYNSDILKEVGFDTFPTTWSEYIKLLKELKSAGYVPISFGNKGNWYAESVWFSTLGNRYTGDEWYESIRSRSGASFMDQDFISSLDAFKELSDIGAFNSDLNSIDNNQLKTLYYNKQAAMFGEGTWAISALENNAPEDVLEATELAVLPAFESGKGNPNTITGGAGWGWGTTSNLKDSQVEAAAGFLYEISSEEFAKEMLSGNSVSPYDTEDYDKSNLSPLTIKFHKMIEDKNLTFIPVYDHQLSPSVIDAMKVGLQELLIGVMTSEEVAASIQEEYLDD